jgi:hypothetical protein
VYNIETNEITEMSDSFGTFAPPTWSRNGDQLALSSGSGIAIFDAASGAQTQVIVAGFAPSSSGWTKTELWAGSPLWSPNGATVAAVIIGESAQEEAGFINLATGALIRLAPEIRRPGATGFAFPERWGVWSADSSQLLWATDHSGIWSWDAESEQASQVVPDDSVIARGGIDLSSDGRWLVYAAGNGSQPDVIVYDIRNGELTRFPGDAPVIRPAGSSAVLTATPVLPTVAPPTTPPGSITPATPSRPTAPAGTLPADEGEAGGGAGLFAWWPEGGRGKGLSAALGLIGILLALALGELARRQLKKNGTSR